jgi:hypothetical protein
LDRSGWIRGFDGVVGFCWIDAAHLEEAARRESGDEVTPTD